MKRPWATLIFLFSCLFCPITAAQAEAAPIQPNLLHTYLRQGVQKVFNLETSEAMAIFQKAMELDRENPIGYSFLALGHLFSYEMSFDPKAREKDQEAMLEDVEASQAKGEKRVRMNSRDGQAYFALTLAKIVKVRWALNQKKYLTVAQEAANAWDYIEKAKELDPQNYDVYFPIGLLHYHIDHLPGVARFFSSLFITAGDRQKGLQELGLAAQKGDLLKELAQAELSSVYTYFEYQPDQALPITLELKERFPRNYNFLFALANTLSELQRFDEAFAVAREIEKGLQAGRPPFVPQLQPRYDHMLGRILFNQGDYPRAAESFQKALKDASVYNARIRVSALVRLGMIQDIRRERKKAEDYYSRALEIEGGEGIAQVEARKYLQTPYTPRPKSSGPPRAGPS